MLEIGSIIDGKYKILNVVGKGGMSVVYLAMNERANKQWAIKEVRKDGVQNFEVVKQNLIVETELLKRFNHPNLPSIIDVIDGDGTFLIVMDYIEGNPLSKAIETSGAQSQEDVIEWAKQLCDVLGYLHSRKPPIIYRDMKPSNVMLKPDGNVMLIDFGTAREFKSNSVADTTCLGTQGYAAPEQFGGQGQTDARTDIYCLGATMYHLVTGHNPCTPPYEMYPIRQWNPMLSSGLEEIILKCIQKNPNDRYQSCAELLYALDHYTDLDVENKKVQNLKWNTFMTSMILMIVMLIGSISFGAAYSVQKSSTYESYISKAQNAAGSDKESAANYYASAMKLNPGDITAYIGLLDLYGSDTNIDEDEYIDIYALMEKYEDSITKSDPQGFADEFAYQYAQYLFFAYNVDGDSSLDGKVKSKPWFDKVVELTENDEYRERAELLSNLAKNYSNLGKTSYNGDDKISYIDYWSDLEQIIRSDLAETENISIALSIYKFVVLEMYNKSNEFFNDGLTVERYESMLNNIEQYVSEIPSLVKYKDNESQYSAQISEINEIIKNTRNVISNTNAASSDAADEEEVSEYYG